MTWLFSLFPLFTNIEYQNMPDNEKKDVYSESIYITRTVPVYTEIICASISHYRVMLSENLSLKSLPEASDKFTAKKKLILK
jgi:hypothetical protein